MVETPLDNRGDLPVAAVKITTRMGGRGRFYAALVCLSCIGIIGFAAWLKPDPKGYGTHRQLGFGKCGMLVTSGYPCPTCGMTTAFAYTVRGRFIKAFLAHPAGLALALATIATGLVSGWIAATSRVPQIHLPFVTAYRLLLLFLILLIGGWGFKVLLGLAEGTLPDRG